MILLLFSKRYKIDIFLNFLKKLLYILIEFSKESDVREINYCNIIFKKIIN